MKKLKLWFLLSLLLVTVGCEAEYHLKIEKDLSIKEAITLTESNDTIYSYGSSIDSFFEETINQIADNYNANQYEITKEIGDFESKALATRSYNNYQSLTDNNFLLNELFSDLTIERDPYYDNLVIINFKAIANYDPFIENEDLNALFEKITFIIQVPYYVTTTNADYINQDQNVYSWYYDKDNMAKDIELEFDLNRPISQSFIDQFQSALGGSNFFPFIIGAVVLSVILLGGFYLVALIKHNNSV